MEIHVSSQVDQTYPGACFGFLAVDHVTNPSHAPELEAHKSLLQEELRSRYPEPAAIKADPVLQAYSAYYKRFKKTYHVALQLESVALKGRPIPGVAALVETMFMAELQDRLLTAGHDLDRLSGDIVVDAAQGYEIYTLLRGAEQQLKPGDLFMRDETGVISSILYGPDERTQIAAGTTRALFTVYAPPGVGQDRVREHLARILEYIHLFQADAKVLFEYVS